jgi:hypothetical protein
MITRRSNWLLDFWSSLVFSFYFFLSRIVFHSAGCGVRSERSV